MKMRTLLLLAVATAALLLAAPSASADKPIKVFILAGQSNMQGKGVVSYDDENDYNAGKGNLVWSMKHSANKDKMKHLRDARGNWTQRSDVLISYKVKNKVRSGKLTVGYTNFGGESHIGPELQFGHVVGDHFNERVYLIKTAWGGKSLFADFRPPSAGGQTGPYYQQMRREVNEALAELDGKPFEIAGFVWMQGWNDMINKDATAEYADNLVHLAKDVRAAFKSPNLPIIIGELGNSGATKPGSGMQLFRDQQAAGAKRIDNAVFVQTHPFARDPEMSPNKGHGHHWFGNAESYFLVGEALGKAAVQMSEGKHQEKNAADQDAAAALVGDWTSSYEEKGKRSDPEIFRPTDSKEFPLSRFRMRYVFNADQSCRWLYLDPADAHRMVDGTWKLDPKDKTQALIFDAKGKQQNISFKIIELDKDQLQLKVIQK